MKHEDIINDKFVKRMFNRKGLTQETKQQYKITLTEYCTLIGKTPTELRKEAIHEQRTIIDKMERHICEYLDDYLEHLKQRPILNSSIKHNILFVRAFYNEYEIDMPKAPRLQPDNIIKPKSDLININMIRNALDLTGNVKEKAIILLLATSGMRSKDLKLLKVQDFIDATTEYHDKTNIKEVLNQLKEQENIVPCWNFYNKKKGVETITFNTPECTNYIISYLNQRKNLRNDDYLFISRINEPFMKNGIQRIFIKLNTKMNLGKLPNKYHIFRAHRLRTFFNNTLISRGVEYSLRKKMLGQTYNPSDQPYTHPTRETCKDAYETCIESLTTTTTQYKTLTSKEMQEIVERLNSKEKSEKELRTYIKNLQKDVEKLKKS